MQEYVITECSTKTKECFTEKHKGQRKREEKYLKLKKFEEFWAGIWEVNTKTAHRKWMNTVAGKITNKVSNVQEFIITEKKLYKTAKKRKNWWAPGTDGIQNYCRNTKKCFKHWTEQPSEIPEWLTQGQTVLVAKTEDQSNERNYHQVTCLNATMQLFTSTDCKLHERTHRKK